MPALHRSSGRDRACDVDGRTGGWTNRFVLTAACAAAATALLVGCGSSSSAPSGSNTGTAAPTASGSNTGTGAPASGTPAVCTQAGEFEAALGQVTSINVIQQGTNGVKAAADNVQTQFNALKQTASSQYQSQVDALQSAVSNLENVANNLGSQSNPVQAVTSAVGQLATAAKAFSDAISSSCPGGIPSVSASPPSASPS
ncbi:MAG: hypothetical protein ACXV3F_10440 [Frankiaceae bacterium]